jgi:HlyD family secretion protein
MAKRNNNRLLLILGIIAGALVLFAIAGKSMGWIGKEKLTEVETTTAKKGEITEKVSASGKIQPEVEVKISPDVPGEIIDMFVKEGDSVVKGQLLLRIRPENYISARDRSLAALNSSRASAAQSAAQLAQLQAQLTRSKLEYDRQKKLFDQKVISEADFQTAEANYKVAFENVEAAKKSLESANYQIRSSEANVKDASENLRKTEIFAPVSGTISKLSVEKGERVVGTSQMAGTEILRIANLNSMEVQVDVNENDIVRVSLGDTAEIEVDSYSKDERKFKGIVTEIANTANATASQDAVTEFQVKIRILQESYQDLLAQKNKMAPFRPGMTASVQIITDKRSDILTVPIAAVVTRTPDELKPVGTKGDKPANIKPVSNETTGDKEVKKEELKTVVFVVENGKAAAKEVKTGISDYGNIEIKSGIKEKDEVVSGSYNVLKKLKNGEAVTKKSTGKEVKPKN